MGSSYVKNFINRDSKGNVKKYKDDVIRVIDDLESGEALKHYINYNVSESSGNKSTETGRGGIPVDWKLRFTTSNYISLVLDEYSRYFKALEIDGGYSTLKPKSKDIIDTFLQKINLRKFIKKVARMRKKCGDVYVYFYEVSNDDDSNLSKSLERIKNKKSGTIEIESDLEEQKYSTLGFKLFGGNEIEIIEDLDGNPIAYVWEDIITHKVKREIDPAVARIAGRYEEKQTDIQIYFERGAVYLYVDGVLDQQQKLGQAFKGIFPIMHFQFEKEEDSPYSINPSEDLIDMSMEIDRIESSIKHINNISSHPQLGIIDGIVDEEASEFGANSIFYVDSIRDTDKFNDIPNQAKVMQLEIKNDLKTLQDELKQKEELLYHKANLPSQSTYKELLKTENSKVWENVRKSLEEEISEFYDEFIFNTKPLFEILLKINNAPVPKVAVSFKKPEFIIEPSIFDVYLLIAQKMNNGELSPQQHMRNSGLTEQEITKIMKEIAEYKVVTNPVEAVDTGTSITTGDVKIDSEISENSNAKQLDNRMKNQA